MGKIHIPSDPKILELDVPNPGQVSDGYHTFDELYEHRSLLFVALMRSNPDISWRANRHEDGTMFPGFFIAGVHLPTGDISYHLSKMYWRLLDSAGIQTRVEAPAFDGHTPEAVLDRLEEWILLKHNKA